MQIWRSTLNAGKRLLDPSQFRSFLLSLWTTDLRLALLLCLPGVVIAIILRIWLTYHMPYGFVHGDTAQELSTALRLLENGKFVVHYKKTFLTPLLYSISAVAHIPVLYFAPVVQHWVGVLLVVVTGLLTRAWLSSWRVWIVPLTVLIAINPIFLWYEHTALPESLTVFGAVTIALAGTFFFRRPNRYTITILFLAALFVAGARPEGRFFALFALALVIRRLWCDWSRLKIYAAVSGAWVFLIFMLTRTSQSGILLYASLIHWSPPHLVVEPGLAEAMKPYQIEATHQWETYRLRHIKLRKRMYKAAVELLMAKGLSERAAEKQVNSVFKRAGMEIALRNFWLVPGLAIQKFFMGHHEPPALGFSDYAIKGQLRALYLVNGGKRALEFSRLLWGVPMATLAEARPFLESNYDVIVGKKLTDFLNAFVRTEVFPAIPMEMPGSPLQDIPWLYLCGLIGAICLVLRERPPFGVQFIWVLFLCTLFVLLMITGNVRARYRMIFEPFWFIYLFGLLDSVVALVQGGLNSASRRRDGRSLETSMSPK
jgi:hypothetical protein